MSRKILLSCGLMVLLVAAGAVWAQEQEAEPPAEEETSPLVDEEVDVAGPVGVACQSRPGVGVGRTDL